MCIRDRYGAVYYGSAVIYGQPQSADTAGWGLLSIFDVNYTFLGTDARVPYILQHHAFTQIELAVLGIQYRRRVEGVLNVAAVEGDILEHDGLLGGAKIIHLYERDIFVSFGAAVISTVCHAGDQGLPALAGRGIRYGAALVEACLLYTSRCV